MHLLGDLFQFQVHNVSQQGDALISPEALQLSRSWAYKNYLAQIQL